MNFAAATEDERRRQRKTRRAFIKTNKAKRLFSNRWTFIHFGNGQRKVAECPVGVAWLAFVAICTPTRSLSSAYQSPKFEFEFKFG